MSLINKTIKYLSFKVQQRFPKPQKPWHWVDTKRIQKLYKKYRKKTIEQSSKSTLAICIPCYNHQNYIKQSLDSVVKQTVKPNEIIIVNDKSPDNSDTIIKDFINRNQQYAHIKYIINEQNLGQAASLNKAIATSKADLIMILNDDDLLINTAVEVVLNTFSRYPESHLVGAGCYHLSKNEIPILTDNNDNSKLEYINYPKGGSKNFVHSNDINMAHTSSTFTKTAWKTVNGYNSNKKKRVCLPSDRDIQMRINLAYSAVVIKNKNIGYWRNYSSVDGGLNS